MKVFVLDSNNKVLMPTHSAKARILLKQGKAKVYHLDPFVVKLNYMIDNVCMQKVKVGIDDGAKQAGIAVVAGCETVFTGTLTLTNNIKDKMEARAGFRRGRRNRLRYRKPRFNNRMITKCAVCGKNARSGHDTCRLCKGTNHMFKSKTYWLPPSVKARKDYVVRTINKLNKWIPIDQVIIETGRFDLQKLMNPEITNEEYQQGPMYGKDSLKAALISEYGNKVNVDGKTRTVARCCYCGKENVPLEVEHIFPKGKGGTDAWHNLTLACKECNQFKGNRTPEEAGMKLLVKPLKFYQTRLLKYATQLQQGKNYLKQAIYDAIGVMPTFTYGQFTSWQRKKFDIPKTHINDAIMVAITTYDSDDKPEIPEVCCDEYTIKAMGTKARAMFTATHYSPKDFSYRDKESGKRKRINSLDAGVRFKHTVRALKEINQACVIVNGKAVAVKTTERIPDNATMIVAKGDMVKARVKNDYFTGRVVACMSNGNIKICVNNKDVRAVSLRNTVVKSKCENVLFQRLQL